MKKEITLPCVECVLLAMCKAKAITNKNNIGESIGKHQLSKYSNITSRQFWVIQPIIDYCDIIRDSVDSNEPTYSDDWIVEKTLYDYLTSEIKNE